MGFMKYGTLVLAVAVTAMGMGYSNSARASSVQVTFDNPNPKITQKAYDSYEYSSDKSTMTFKYDFSVSDIKNQNPLTLAVPKITSFNDCELYEYNGGSLPLSGKGSTTTATSKVTISGGLAFFDSAFGSALTVKEACKKFGPGSHTKSGTYKFDIYQIKVGCHRKYLGSGQNVTVVGLIPVDVPRVSYNLTLECKAPPALNPRLAVPPKVLNGSTPMLKPRIAQ